MKELIYLGYYLKNLDTKLYSRFLNYSSNKTGKWRIILIIDSVLCTLRYKISLLEYFQFGFYKLNTNEKKKWVGTGYMYEYQRLMNPVNKREILNDKILFCKSYKLFIDRNVFDIKDLKDNPDNITKILGNSSNKLVFKSKKGKCGKQVEIRLSSDFSKETIVGYMTENGFDMIEDFILQHPSLAELSPNSVNTIRIITNLSKQNEVNILGCRLRMGIEKYVDNLASGGIVVEVEEKTGIVISTGVYSDITKNNETIHPVSGKQILGFQIPFWEETVDMVKKAALLHTQNRSIGWDIAITEFGPELIEANHDWCEKVYQLPLGKGMKDVIESYRSGRI